MLVRRLVSALLSPVLAVDTSLISLLPKSSHFAEVQQLRPDLEEKYWVFVINSGYRFGDNPDSVIQRNTQVELNKMVPRGRLELPAHGFSVLPNDPINAFLDDRISRGLSVQTIEFAVRNCLAFQGTQKRPL